MKFSDSAPHRSPRVTFASETFKLKSRGNMRGQNQRLKSLSLPLREFLIYLISLILTKSRQIWELDNWLINTNIQPNYKHLLMAYSEAATCWTLYMTNSTNNCGERPCLPLATFPVLFWCLKSPVPPNWDFNIQVSYFYCCLLSSLLSKLLFASQALFNPYPQYSSQLSLLLSSQLYATLVSVQIGPQKFHFPLKSFEDSLM